MPPIANTAATAADRRAAATVSSAPSPEDASRAAVCSRLPEGRRDTPPQSVQAACGLPWSFAAVSHAVIVRPSHASAAAAMRLWELLMPRPQ